MSIDVDYYIQEYALNQHGDFDEDDCMEYVKEHIDEEIRSCIRDFNSGLSSLEKQHEYNFFDIFEEMGEEDVKIDVNDENTIYTFRDSRYYPIINKAILYKTNSTDAEWKICSLGNKHEPCSSLPGVRVLYDDDGKWIKLEIERDSPFILRCIKTKENSPVKFEYEDWFTLFLSNFKGHISGHPIDDHFTKHPIRYITRDEEDNYVRTYISYHSYVKGSKQYDMLRDGIRKGEFDEYVLGLTILSHPHWLVTSVTRISNNRCNIRFRENLYIDVILNDGDEDEVDKVDVVAYSNVGYKYNWKYLLDVFA